MERTMHTKTTASEYDTDFYAWTFHNAALIREGRFSELDIDNIAEEIEGMGRSEKRELFNRFVVLIMHLLKWKFQPSRQSKSWRLTIKSQRVSILHLLKQNPSLKHIIESTWDDAHEEAVLSAAAETGMDENTFPKKCPFTLDQCLDLDFFPE